MEHSENNFNLGNSHSASKHKLKYSKSAIENAITNGISLGIYRTTNYFQFFPSNCIVKTSKNSDGDN